MLLVAALSTAAFAVFPSISGFASGGAETLPSDVNSAVIFLEVDGMTCESCTSAVRSELLDVTGVIDAAVSYERKKAEVRVREERPPGVELLLEAVKKAGYSATVAEN